jgi:signal transduction histidine kinase
VSDGAAGLPQRRFQRERRARKQAESLLEIKSRELFQANVELRKLNESLEERVRKRTAELAEARDRALEASRAKSAFLANMSHELRTPLNAIIGYAEMLEEDAEDLGMEQAGQDLGKIQTAGRHLLELINGILDLSKVEAGKMQLYLERFQIVDLLHVVEATVAPLMQKNGNEFKVEAPEDLGEMVGDMAKVRQVLTNLLSNAAKFTKQGEVTLSAREETEDGRAFIVFDVSDTGIGLSQEQQDLVFRPFTQADSSTTRKFGGTGLGLTIGVRFCELMGGGLSVSSTLGEGSTFTTRIPRDQRGDGGEAGAAESRGNEPSA